MRSFKKISPSFYPVLSFLLIILTGTLALALLPTRDGRHLSVIDSLFMATSATCVTGLAVTDIGTQFTLWGQLTILALIQVGGLGIMTFSTVMVMLLGGSVSFKSRFVLQDVFTQSPQADFYTLLRHVLLFTFSFEAVGALLLFVRFNDRFDPGTAAYYALFHSISAFCNAGFALFSDSFMGYRGDPLINLTLITLIISGGIGFMVLHELLRERSRSMSLKQHWNRISLHSKMVTSVTAMLLVGGAAFFLVSEWSHTLNGLPLWEKILAALFQSVTPRTAGFNTLDYGAMNNLTLLATIILMFIGASPGSTGGGIKTSSLGVLLALSRARLKGSEHVHVFKRSLSDETINRAFAIFVLSVVIVMLGTAVLLITEAGDVSLKASRGLFIELLFETASAFGTVGLSMGVTPALTSWGKFLLVLIMYTGRLGPLVIAMAIQPSSRRAKYFYAEERVMIG